MIDITISSSTTEVAVSAASTIVQVATSVPLQSISAQNIAITPSGSITATNLEAAINELANQQFSSAFAPTGSNVEVGDTWYNTDDNIFYVYRTIDGVTDWRPLVSGNDISDGGTF
jgi:hypothetical protein